jgi:hypothetical protein
MSTFHNIISGLAQQAGAGGLSWWVWLIVIVIILVVIYMVWSTLISDEEVADIPAQAVEEPAPVEPVIPDNLTKIEGIGPKINQLLQESGIQTFGQLAGADVGEIDKLLEAAKLTFADASSWPEQAKLAATGDWEALEKLQDELQGGKR